jgi:SAM-dependent methyltransferase
MGAIYRERRASVLRFVDRLNLCPEARALEVGCGAGTTSIALAKRKLRVDAVDAVPDMVGLTKQAAGANGVGKRVSVRTGDVHQLAFDDDSFDLALAIGVMEWMPSYDQPLRELHRVLRPGGWLIVNVDNSRALHCLIDPRMNPLVGPAKRYGRQWAVRAGLTDPLARPSRCSRSRFDRALLNAGLHKSDSRTCGFGPLTMLGVHLFPERAEIALHHILQSAADHHVPLLKDGGDCYLVLAQKRGKP